MKYPLRIELVHGRRWKYAIVDADHAVIFHVMNDRRGLDLAMFVVRAANRWHRWRVWFRPYTRDDWLWEKNKMGEI